MPYEKQTWTNGDLMTASKLNHIEDGLAALSAAPSGGVVVIPAVVENGAYSYIAKTPNEIKAYFDSGVLPVIYFPVITGQIDTYSYKICNSLSINESTEAVEMQTNTYGLYASSLDEQFSFSGGK